MKKYLTSLAFLVSFVGYAALQYLNSSNSASDAPVVSTASSVSQPAPGSVVSSQPTPPPPAVPPQGQYVDGVYTGSTKNAFYGLVQVQAKVSGGKIANVRFLQYPNDRSTSRFINKQAMPILEQEAIQAQSANVDGVSGASDTSAAFRQSLASALAQARS